MERVKLTFERSDNGERVIIRKDGGFSTADVAKLTELVEDLFSEGGATDSANEDKELETMGEENTESSDGNGGDGKDQSFINRVQEEAKRAVAASQPSAKPGATTPPAGRGQVAAKLPDGTGITKEGDVDRRTLRGNPQNPDPRQQQVAKKIERAAGRPEAGA